MIESKELRCSTELVLLDYDDTMGATERIALGAAYKLTVEMFRQIGFEVPHTCDEHIERFPGETYRKISRDLAMELGCKLSEETLEKFAELEVDRVIDALGRELEPMDGSLELLGFLQEQGVQAAVVSSSALRRLHVCLERTGQNQFIPHAQVFSATDSMEKPISKPNPAIYQYALEQMKGNPDRTVAVEDSGSGVLSAINAGVRCIGFVGALPEDKRAQRKKLLLDNGACAVVESLREVEALL